MSRLARRAPQSRPPSRWRPSRRPAGRRARDVVEVDEVIVAAVENCGVGRRVDEVVGGAIADAIEVPRPGGSPFPACRSRGWRSSARSRRARRELGRSPRRDATTPPLPGCRMCAYSTPTSVPEMSMASVPAPLVERQAAQPDMRARAHRDLLSPPGLERQVLDAHVRGARERDQRRAEHGDDELVARERWGGQKVEETRCCDRATTSPGSVISSGRFSAYQSCPATIRRSRRRWPASAS